MNPFSLAFREIAHRWKSGFAVLVLVAIITGTLTFFTINRSGFEREISRNARDIGSNVVILPIDVDQFQYHAAGGFSEITMPATTVQQIIEYKASLNHLIPMLERKAECSYRGRAAQTRVIGIAASIPMPGRPKAPMQKSVGINKVQLGSQLAAALGIKRDEKPIVKIHGAPFTVERVNRESGTWQDSVAMIDLATAQSVFELPDRISRIEAIECTDERCAETGLQSNVVLTNELARITDQATILRREKIAKARQGIRTLNHANLQILENVLWFLLAAGIIGLSSLNIYQRQSEIGVMQALGYRNMGGVVTVLATRSILLTLLGSTAGILIGARVAFAASRPLFLTTGKKFSIDWPDAIQIGIIAMLVAAVASSLPTILAAMRHPADIIGKER